MSGSVTSTKQFVGEEEERDCGGSVTRQFFKGGEVISGTAYFYVKDHLGSVRELTDSSGVRQASYCFDPYGQTSEHQGSVDADYQFAGMYKHGRSELYLSDTRSYLSRTASWLNRDFIGESGGQNLYSYVLNSPIFLTDPIGTAAKPTWELVIIWWPLQLGYHGDLYLRSYDGRDYITGYAGAAIGGDEITHNGGGTFEGPEVEKRILLCTKHGGKYYASN